MKKKKQKNKKIKQNQPTNQPNKQTKIFFYPSKILVRIDLGDWKGCSVLLHTK